MMKNENEKMNLIESIFVCSNDSEVVISSQDNEQCPRCKAGMDLAGWSEAVPKEASTT